MFKPELNLGRTNWTAALALASGVFFCISTSFAFSATAGESGFSGIPSGITTQDIQSNPNCSLLNDYHYTDASNPLASVVDRHTELELRQRYDDMNRDYDMRRQYGLGGVTDDIGHIMQVSDLGHDAMQKVESYQGEKAKASVTTNPGMQPLMAPAAVVGGAAALYRGTGVNLYHDGDFKVRAKASVRNQTTGMELSSPIVQGSVDMTMTAPSTMDPTCPPPLDPMARTERYRVSLSRSLPMNVSSGFYYGTTTSTMSAYLSRKLTDHLTAIVDTAKTMDPSVETVTPSEQSLRFTYGLNF